jgi:hypothetical protein
MRPVKPNLSGETDLFRSRLDQIINMRHELVRLAQTIDWDGLVARFSQIAGYRCLSLIRVSGVVKCQFALV